MACGPEFRDVADPLGIGDSCVEVWVQNVVSDVTDVSSVRSVFAFDLGLGFQTKLTHEFPHQFLGHYPSTVPQHQVDPAVPKAVFLLLKQPRGLSFEHSIFIWSITFGQMIIFRGLCQVGSMQQVDQFVFGYQGGDRLDLEACPWSLRSRNFFSYAFSAWSRLFSRRSLSSTVTRAGGGEPLGRPLGFGRSASSPPARL